MKVGNNKQFLTGLSAVVLAAGLASAQSSGFDKPLKSGQPSSSSSPATSTTFMSQDDGENRCEVRFQDGKVVAKVNGKSVPDERIVQNKGEIKILDENGKVMSTFQVGQPGQPPVAVGRGRSGARIAPAAPAQPLPPAAAMAGLEPPKVMLGINMSEPGPDLLKAFGLNKGESILIDRVIDGLPAEKAGIQENDVVTEINGKKPATPETLREALKDKEPGDTITFTVMRKDGDQAIRVKLVKYDAEKLGMAMEPGWKMEQFEGQGFSDEARQKMEDAIKKGMQQGSRLQWHDGDAPVVVGPEGRAFSLGTNAKLDAKMAELDKKLAELDKKMARLDELFAKLQEQLEKIPKNGGR